MQGDGKGDSQLEKRVGYLQHEDVRVVVLVADEDAFAGAPHAVVFVVFFEALEAGEDGRVFFRLVFLGPECVVAQGIKADCDRLIRGEGFGENGSA